MATDNTVTINVAREFHTRMVSLRLEMEGLNPNSPDYAQRRDEILDEVDAIEKTAMEDFEMLKKRLHSMADFVHSKKNPLSYWFWRSLIATKMYGLKALKTILIYAVLLVLAIVVAKQVWRFVELIWSYA